MLTHEQKVIDALQVSSALAAAVERDQLAKEAQDKAILADIPAAVEACIQHGRVAAEDREKLASALKDHRRTVRLLAKVAAHSNETEKTASIGSPVNAGGAKPNKDTIRESDRIFAQRLGL